MSDIEQTTSEQGHGSHGNDDPTPADILTAAAAGLPVGSADDPGQVPQQPTESSEGSAQAEASSDPESPAGQDTSPTPPAPPTLPAPPAPPAPRSAGEGGAEPVAAPADASVEPPAAPSAPEGDAPKPAAPKIARPAPKPTQVAPSFPAPSGSPAAPAAPAVPAAPLDPVAAAAARAFGRVDEERNVYVRDGAAERRVGQVPGADDEAAMDLYVRRYLDLEAQVALLETRVSTAAVKDVDASLAALREALTEPAAVGDLAVLRARTEALEATAAERRERAAAERAAARARAVTEREKIVTEAETIAAQDPGRTQWKQSGERLRALLDEWKAAQRKGPRLDKATEDGLWRRFSHSRTTFDRHRRQWFSELDAKQGEVKKVKEDLIARAEKLSSSTDWGPTSVEYRRLMDEWKAAGRASRKEDDALWARFRDARQRFFDARHAANEEIDQEYAANLQVKLNLLQEAEKLVPVTNLERAKSALRDIQERWEAAGKVPRGDVQRVEGRLRAVEQAVRDTEQAEWKRSDPETQARADGMAAQLEESLAKLEKDLEAARAQGDQRAVAALEESLTTRRSWLEQVRSAQD